MNLGIYETLTGITVATSQQTRVEAEIVRAKGVLETMLGYTLDPELYDTNYYTETGKTQTDCPQPDANLTLDAPDAVVFAYRLFPYNKKDLYLSLDPASAIHKVKLVKDGVTYKTLLPSEYRLLYNRGIVKYLEQTQCWCVCNDINYCNNMQLAIDATWLWDTEDNIPPELLSIWADIVRYNSDLKSNIQSETLGTHSYRKFDQKSPEMEDRNLTVIKRYAGPLGSVKRTITV